MARVSTPKRGGGTKRPDVVPERKVIDPVTGDTTWEVVHVLDYKTGVAGIDRTWRDEIMRRLHPLHEPEELRPDSRVPAGSR